jgi:hypothetical protein
MAQGRIRLRSVELIMPGTPSYNSLVCFLRAAFVPRANPRSIRQGVIFANCPTVVNVDGFTSCWSSSILGWLISPVHRGASRPMSEQRYLANTNSSFLLNETVLIAQMLLDGIPSSTIRELVIDGNVLERSSREGRKTLARVILDRIEGLDEEFLGLLCGPGEQRRTCNLYTFLRHHRLLREFMLEVVHEKRRGFDRVLRPMDLIAFLTHKLLQEPLIAAWSVQTLEKARSNIARVLTDAGVLEAGDQLGSFEILGSVL